jgi:hypothetical protein
MYPNPSYGYLNIAMENFDGTPVDMLIYDLKGRQMMSRQLTNAQTTLDVVDLEAGIYVVRLESQGETLTRKFVKN